MEKEKRGSAEGEGRSPDRVMVLMQLSQEGQTTLQWALNKCQPGDSITVLHVIETLPAPGGGTVSVEMVEEKQLDFYKEQIGRAYCALLHVFKDVCEYRQVEASVRIAHGTDVKHVVSSEADLVQITKLVLGEYGQNKRSYMRFLVEHLPPTCVVYAVKSGRLTYVKAGKSSTGSSAAPTSGKSGPLTPNSLSSKIFRSQTMNWSNTSTAVPASTSSKSGHPSRQSMSPRTSFSGLLKPSSTELPNYTNSSAGESGQSSFSSKLRKSFASGQFPERTESTPLGPLPQDIPSPRLKTPKKYSRFSSWKSSGSKSGPLVMQPNSAPNSSVLPPSAAPSVSGSQTVSQAHSRSKASHNVSLVSTSPRVRQQAQGKGSLNSNIWSGNLLDRELTQQEIVAALGSMDSAVDQNGGWHDQGLTHGEDGAEDGLAEDDPVSDILQTLPGLDGMWVNYQFVQMENATSGFGASNLIGKGGCSHVFRGILEDGRHVAVKRLQAESSTSDAQREWHTEVKMMAAVRHRHVVPMLGYCLTARERMLVYELLERGNLEDSLHDKRRVPLRWRARTRVALESARGLEYLHNGCINGIIHRDIKTSNILLTEDGGAKIADFGLAMWNPGKSGTISVEVVGTFGYLAPEYFMYGQVNEKTDVYSFGVVLLELITGRMPIDVARPKGEENLVLWAKPLMEQGKALELVDPRLAGDFETEEVLRLVEISQQCLQNNAERRPSMRHVLRLLEDACSEEEGGGEGAVLERQKSREVDELFLLADLQPDCAARKQFAELVLDGLDEDQEENTASSSDSFEATSAGAKASQYLAHRSVAGSSLTISTAIVE